MPLTERAHLSLLLQYGYQVLCMQSQQNATTSLRGFHPADAPGYWKQHFARKAVRGRFFQWEDVPAFELAAVDSRATVSSPSNIKSDCD